MFHTASGKAVYPTVFMRGVFGPAEAALPVETQGLRFHDLRHPRATTLNLYGHVLRCTEAALVHALDAIYEHATQGSWTSPWAQVASTHG